MISNTRRIYYSAACYLALLAGLILAAYELRIYYYAVILPQELLR